MSQMSQIRILSRALFRRSANIYVSKLRFAVVWLGQIHNLDTGHVYLLGLKSGSERLSIDRSINPWISIDIWMCVGTITQTQWDHGLLGGWVSKTIFHHIWDHRSMSFLGVNRAAAGV